MARFSTIMPFLQRYSPRACVNRVFQRTRHLRSGGNEEVDTRRVVAFPACRLSGQDDTP